MTIADLIARLEEAEGPDMTIDRDISRLILDGERRTEPFVGILAFDHHLKAYWVFGSEDTKDGPKEKRWSVLAKGFTSFIDAALTLVPEGWGIFGFTNCMIDPKYLNVRALTQWQAGIAKLGADYSDNVLAIADLPMGKGATPAIALCIASLRARDAGKERT